MLAKKEHERNTTNIISPKVCTTKNNKTWHTKAKPPERKKEKMSDMLAACQ